MGPGEARKVFAEVLKLPRGRPPLSPLAHARDSMILLAYYSSRGLTSPVKGEMTARPNRVWYRPEENDLSPEQFAQNLDDDDLRRFGGSKEAIARHIRALLKKRGLRVKQRNQDLRL
jgi:hypothetical protein